MSLPPRSEFTQLAGEGLVIRVDLLVGSEGVFALGFVRTKVAFEQRIFVVCLKMAFQVVLEPRTEREAGGRGVERGENTHDQ